MATEKTKGFFVATAEELVDKKSLDDMNISIEARCNGILFSDYSISIALAMENNRVE